MLNKTTLTLLGAAALALTASSARAETYSDTGAAVLIWPKIVVNDTTDTLVQISNQADVASMAHCFYVNANSRCTNTGAVCESSSECPGGRLLRRLPAGLDRSQLRRLPNP